MPKNRKFLSLAVVYLLALSFLFSIVNFVPTAEAQLNDIEVSLWIDRPYYLRGETCKIAVTSSSSSSVSLTILNPSNVTVLSETVNPNATVSYPIPSNAEYGLYTVKCEGYTTWFWLQKIDEIYPISVPYSWTWKGVNYTLLENYVLRAEGFDASFEIGWLSEIFTKFKPSISLYRNEYLVLIKTWGKDIDAEHWLMSQYRGLKIRINGTVASSTTLKWNFKNQGEKEILWRLDRFDVGHLVYDWSDFDTTGVSYSLDKTNSKMEVYLTTTFDVDPYIWQSGFETNDFSEWLSTASSPQCSMTVQSTTKYAGTYAAQCHVDGGPDRYSYAKRNFTQAQIAYAQMRFQLDALPPDGKRTGAIIVFTASNYPHTGVAIRNNSGTYELILSRLANGADYYQWVTALAYAISIQTGEWYLLEIEAIVDQTDGAERVYWQGSIAINSTGRDNNGKGNVSELRVGFWPYGGLGQWARNMYIDDVKYDEDYIGSGDKIPESSNEAHNSTVAGEPCQFSCLWEDDINLSTCLFTTNNTGSWQANETLWSDAGVDSKWANLTKTLNSTEGVAVGYRWYCNDSTDQWGDSGIKYLTTTVVGPPTYSNVGYNNTVFGQPTKFYCKWEDSQGLSGFIFGSNNTGPQQNESWVPLSGVLAWGNKTIDLNSTIGVVIKYEFYCNDTDDTWNSTVNYLTVTDDTVFPVYSNVGANNTLVSKSTTFYCLWQDNINLNCCLFNHNNTGTWQTSNVTVWTNANTKVKWANVSLTLNGTEGARVEYRWYCNDTSGNMNGTGIKYLTTTGYVSAIHVDGKYIKDVSGNIVHLTGTNRGHFEDGPTGGWGGFTVFSLADCEMELDYMKSIGINIIRIYTQVDYWVYNTPGNKLGGGTMPHRDIFKTIVEEAEERGIYIIYCPWSVAGAQQAGFPYPTSVLPDRQAFVDYWVSVVNELGVYSNVIWEIWNEPGGGSEYTPAFQAIINAIRATGDDHIIVIGYKMNISYLDGYGPVFSEWVFNPYPILRFNDSDGNIVYSGHIYRSHQSFWDGTYNRYKYDDIKSMLQSDNMQIKRIGDEWGLPLLIGEIGPGDWGGNELENACFNNCLSCFNEWGVSYTAWDWHKNGEWTMFSDVWLGQAGPRPNNAGQYLIRHTYKKTSPSTVGKNSTSVSISSEQWLVAPPRLTFTLSGTGKVKVYIYCHTFPVSDVQADGSPISFSYNTGSQFLTFGLSMSTKNIVVYFGGGEYRYFQFLDKDNATVQKSVTWQLWNSSQQISYSQGQSTLVEDNYTLKTFYQGYLVNVTEINMTVWAEKTFPVYLQMKKHSNVPGGYIAFNQTISITINSQAKTNLTFTVSGSSPILMVIDVRGNASYIQRNGVNQTWVYNVTERFVLIETASLSVWQLIFGNIWRMNFAWSDLDDYDVSSLVTWEIWNETQKLTYSQDALTLLDGTYTIKTFFDGELINTTSFSTETYGNMTATVFLHMKKHSAVTGGYIIFNSTISSITLNSQAKTNLTFTVAGSYPTKIMISVPFNASYIRKDGMYQSGWVYDHAKRRITIETSSLSTWELVFRIWRFTWRWKDLDNENVTGYITWQLWNGSQQLTTYSMGQASLWDDTYTLKTFYGGKQISYDSFPTNTYGNLTTTIYLQMKSLPADGYIAFNNPVSAITINKQTSTNLTFTASGEGTFQMVVKVPQNASYILKDGVEQTGWTYDDSNKVITLTTDSLSVWEFIFPSEPSGPGGGETPTEREEEITYTLTIKVIDTEAHSLSNAKVTVWTLLGSPIVSKSTDLYGYAHFSIAKRTYMVSAEHEGYDGLIRVQVKNESVSKTIIVDKRPKTEKPLSFQTFTEPVRETVGTPAFIFWLNCGGWILLIIGTILILFGFWEDMVWLRGVGILLLTGGVIQVILVWVAPFFGVA